MTRTCDTRFRKPLLYPLSYGGGTARSYPPAASALPAPPRFRRIPPWPLLHPVISAVAWCAAILTAVVPLTLWRYRSRTSG